MSFSHPSMYLFILISLLLVLPQMIQLAARDVPRNGCSTGRNLVDSEWSPAGWYFRSKVTSRTTAKGSPPVHHGSRSPGPGRRSPPHP